jgi:uncharacterized protein DUF5677
MTFQRDGFLGGDESSRIRTARERYAPWFALIDRLNRLAMSVVFADPPPRDSSEPEAVPKLYVAVLFARATELFQGAVLMAERGMDAEARTLIRSCAETAISIGCMRSDPTFIDRLEEGHEKHRLTVANEMLQLPEDESILPSDERARLSPVIAEIHARYEKPRPRPISWANESVCAGMVDIYQTVYRSTSGDASHVSLEALNRFLQADDQARILDLRFGPEFDKLGDTLSSVIAVMLRAIEARRRGLIGEPFENELRACLDVWKSLCGIP